MGTASTKKIIKQVAGTLTEEAALLTSAGAGDADRLPALNASGVLDASIVNSTTTSAGAGSSGKLAALNASGVLANTIVNSTVISSGAGDAAKVVALDSAGRIDTSMMPVGIGADTVTMTTSETIADGDFINIWNSSGPKVRKATAATAGKEAHGFVLVGGGAAANVAVYFEGSNTNAAGTPTPGVVYLSASTPGQATNTSPSAAGEVVQRIGFATSGTSINFQSTVPVVLA